MSIDIKNDSPQTEPGIDWGKRALFKSVIILGALAATKPLIPLVRASSYIPQETEGFKNGYGELSNIIKPNELDDYLKESFRNVLDLNHYSPANTYVQAEGGMLLREPLPWLTPYWWAIFLSAAKEKKQPKIHDEYWPAWVYDNLGGEGNAWDQSIRKAATITREQPHTESYAGYCPWVTVAQLLDPKPQAFLGENLAGQEDSEKIVMLKEGLLAIKESGAIMVPVPKTPQVLLTAIKQGLPISIKNNVVGDWYSAVAGVSENGASVKVTNFGLPGAGPFYSNLSLAEIQSVWVVYQPEADKELKFAEGIRELTSFWKYNVGRNFINELVYPY